MLDYPDVFGMPKILPGDSTAQQVLPLPVTSEGSKQRNWGILLTGVIGGTLVALYSVVTPFIAPALRKHCLPFVPATSKQIENVLNLLKGRNGSLVDIGSGDGRIQLRLCVQAVVLGQRHQKTRRENCFAVIFSSFNCTIGKWAKETSRAKSLQY
uniref:ATP synthase c subunit lysine N-methyltransferase n=1 Tax=Anolis carolinensis TaxID=28377 RepID=G1KK48_ANOCA